LQPAPSATLFAVALFALIIVGASNAVNLTDGLDGLATGCSVTTALAYAAFGYICGNARYSDYLGVAHHSLANELPIVAMAMAGACLGFLWFNAHPAKMFMGDTGSLALGGCIAALAIGWNPWVKLTAWHQPLPWDKWATAMSLLCGATAGAWVVRYWGRGETA
jgi:UDP-N-acetylmuramyl pentapeptide phosphotransferase/UDP-N-acetylglucosamine-1-phosphate transferase